MTSEQDSLPTVARALGVAGLIPFCAAPLALYLDPHHGPVYAQILAGYALAILCFLAGIWWGLSLIRRSPGTLVLSNIVVVAVFLGFTLLPTQSFLVLCAILYPATIIVERRAWWARAQPRYYARLRLGLTLVATGSLLASAALQ